MKENQLTYLQMPLPQGQGSYKILKTDWQGLDKRAEIDTGTLTVAQNISTDAAPYLESCRGMDKIRGGQADGLGLYGFGEVLLAVRWESDALALDYFKGDEAYSGKLFEIMNIVGDTLAISTGHAGKHIKFTTSSPVTITLPALSQNINFSVENRGSGSITFNAATGDKIYTENGELSSLTLINDKNKIDVESGLMWSVFKTGITGDAFMAQGRSIVKFNVFSNVTSPLTGTYIEKLVIFPDRKSIDFNISSNFTPSFIPGMPRIKYAAVHNSRLFGVDDTRIYASAFNDYTNWTLDNIGEEDAEGNLVSGYNENNAWISTSQSNTKGDGKFTGITSYAGHVICFKKDHIQEIYNNKNPFRVVDIYSEGTIDNRSVAEVDGKLIFVSENDVKIYTGGTPQSIGRPLSIGTFDKAEGCGFNGKYYLFCNSGGEKYLFVFDARTGQWTERTVSPYTSHIGADKGSVYLTESFYGGLYSVENGPYDEWSVETCLLLNGSINPKRIRKIQLLADMGAGSTLLVEALSATGANIFGWEHENTSSVKKRFIPIRFKPSASAGEGIKLRISGEGYVRLYQLEIYVYSGGELYK